MQRVGFLIGLAAAVLMLVLPAPPARAPAPVAADPVLVAPEQLGAWIVAGDPGYVLLDVRPAEAFAAGALKTAVSMPAATLDAAAVATLPAHRRVVLYCDTGRLSAAAWRTVRASRDDVYVLGGGLQGWHERVLNPPPPAPDAPPDAWIAYHERLAVANYFTGKTGTAPPPPKQVQPVLRPRGPMKASEGC
jgi:rhodanese-related sulfurtransferase